MKITLNNILALDASASIARQHAAAKMTRQLVRCRHCKGSGRVLMGKAMMIPCQGCNAKGYTR